MFINRDDKYQVIPGKTKDVLGNLEAGLYQLDIQESFFGNSVYLKRNERYKNTNILDSGTFKDAKEHIEEFVSDEMYYIREKMGMMHKLGLIFNGKPGTGKTYLAGQLAEKLAKEKDALCIMSVGEPRVDLCGFVDSLREEHPDRLIVLVIDEYEKRNSGNVDIMSFLDGGQSRNNVIVMATVNSTQHLPDTIIGRVGRIEKVYNFDQVDSGIIKRTIESVVPKEFEQYIDIDSLADQISKGTEQDRRIDNISILVRNMIYAKKTGTKIRPVKSDNNKPIKKQTLPKFTKRRRRN